MKNKILKAKHEALTRNIISQKSHHSMFFRQCCDFCTTGFCFFYVWSLQIQNRRQSVGMQGCFLRKFFPEAPSVFKIETEVLFKLFFSNAIIEVSFGDPDMNTGIAVIMCSTFLPSALVTLQLCVFPLASKWSTFLFLRYIILHYFMFMHPKKINHCLLLIDAQGG